jgi:glutamate dehydrogenase
MNEQDIARGGLRIVTPGTAELVAIEGARQFDEAYALAFAQQLKNKVTRHCHYKHSNNT